MKDFKITIKVAENTVSAENLEEARKQATAICRDIYLKLNCQCTVTVDRVEEVE